MTDTTKTKILFVGTEALPYAATGGLGDVLGSLPAACAAAGAAADAKACAEDEQSVLLDVRAVMPLYSCIPKALRGDMELLCEINVSLAWRNQYCGVWTCRRDGVTWYFLDNEYYFKRPDIYGNYDDGERFAFFCSAVLQMLPHISFYPDILHANDWQSALAVIYLQQKYRAVPEYAGIKSVFTIHNIEYQGKYDMAILGDVFALGLGDSSVVAYDGCINLLKGAVVCADAVTTVSPSYAGEIRTPEYSHGLHYILEKCAYKLSGILNGIDYSYYNPAKDRCLAKNYSVRTFENKWENKLALQRFLGLPEQVDVPLIAAVTRLVPSKGIDLMESVLEEFLRRHPGAQFVVLGTGEQRYENFFMYLQNTLQDQARALILYDRELAKRIYAAADLFLMPSASEPCGLSQMIACRYGAVPVCHETGGLSDSIQGTYEKDGKIEGNGFTFANYRYEELLERMDAALALYADREKWERLAKKAMSTDFSWKRSAQQYLALYAKLLEG